MSKTICLNMVVTGNPAGLSKSLESVKDKIDYWVIADLGLGEQAERIIEDTLVDIEGEIVGTDSDNRTASRNVLIDYSADKADYLLLLDSNTKVVFDDNETDWRTNLTANAYGIAKQGKIRTAELKLINTNIVWQYQGVTCEFLVSPADNIAHSLLKNTSLQVLIDPDADQAKTKSDIDLLETQLKQQPNDGHALFHLARLYLFEGDHEASLKTFQQYLQMDEKWDAEWQWYALHHSAKLLELLEHDESEVIQAYEAAYQFRPKRAEPLNELARFYRERKQTAKAHLHAHQAFVMPLPITENFDLELDVYDWHIPNEYTIACQAMGNHEQAIIASNKAIKNANIKKNLFRSFVASRERSLATLRNNKQVESKKLKHRIRVVVPYRNAGELLEDTARSLTNQDYDNFTATFIDDCSTDDSNSYIPVDDERIELICNTERVGPLVNRMNFINSCEPNDIVLYLDGDDQLASDDTLSYINDFYNQYDCWLSYGQYLSQNGNLGYAQPYPTQKSLLEELETGEMRFPIHPITHRAGLFHKIKDFDPNYSCLKDDKGEWLFYASDAVLARPLFYLAGHEKIHYCDRVLYLYTEGHEISESIHNKKDQIETCRITTTRLKPPRLQSLEL